MRTVDIIQRKRDGQELSTQQIQYIVKDYTTDQIPDYQIAALLMAIYYRGMSARETADLTLAMADSGQRIDLSAIAGTKVDKHSTGGVGDKTSLIVGPLAAAAGVPVAKMSGRGLGHTGGTLDKLESIAGFQVELSQEQFIDHVNSLKLALIGQTGNLVPADKKLYALRDVTATVNSIPLIASSIMSKKIASGADAIVLDVKYGAGAFMTSLDDAKQLAKTMVDIGNALDRKTIAVISDMNEPLGYEVGNANEVREAVQVLSGTGEKRLTELCLTLAAYMCLAAGTYATFQQAYDALSELLYSKQALAKFEQFIKAQGGDVSFVSDPTRLAQASYHLEIKAEQSGYVQALHAEKIGVAAMLLGAGRQTKDDAIDYAAGITLTKKCGYKVQAGEVIAILHSNRPIVEQSATLVKEAFTIASEQPEMRHIVYEVME